MVIGASDQKALCGSFWKAMTSNVFWPWLLLLAQAILLLLSELLLPILSLL